MNEILSHNEIPTIESSNRKFFDEQFLKKKMINGMETVYIKPENEDLKTPVIFAPGYARTIDSAEECFFELYKKGRGVMSLNHPRLNGEIIATSEIEDVPAEIQRRATALYTLIMDYVKNSDSKEISMMAHSMGGLDALVAALMVEAKKPGTIKNIVLMNPAGIIGKDSVAGLGRRMFSKVIEDAGRYDVGGKQLSENVSPVKIRESLKYFVSNPARAVREMFDMTSMEIQNLLVELREIGIGISIIHGNDDRQLPMDLAQKNIRSKHVDGFYAVQGEHDEIYRHPEKYIAFAETVLSDLEKKQAEKMEQAA